MDKDEAYEVVVYANGDKFWWIEGVRYTEEEFNKKVKELNNTCTGKVITIDGRNYQLKEI